MKRSIQFACPAIAVASLALALLAADAGAQVRRPREGGPPVPIDWQLRLRRLPYDLYSVYLPNHLFDRKGSVGGEEWQPLGATNTAGGRAGW